MSGVPQWMSDITVGQILAGLVGIGVVVGIWKLWLGKLVQFFQDFRDDWLGVPDRPGVPGRPGAMATLHEHGKQIEEIKAQVTPNHGSQLKLSEELQGLRRQVACLTEVITGQPIPPDPSVIEPLPFPSESSRSGGTDG